MESANKLYNLKELIILNLILNVVIQDKILIWKDFNVHFIKVKELILKYVFYIYTVTMDVD